MSAAGEINLLVAAPHERGPGKTHIWDYTKAKTLCGKQQPNCPGELVWSGDFERVTCLGCLASHEAAERRAREQAQWERENGEWWAWYDAYLQSAAWQRRRQLVLRRARDLCEGCGEQPATIAHHLTYKHVGAEFLFELVAVCGGCHERLHPDGGGPRP